MTAVRPTTVAVIDIGSNSIKVLVAARAADGTMLTLHQRTLDARISAGISHQQPRLADEGIARGLEAIRALLADAQSFAPSATILVATSAVRDAENGGEFRAQVHRITGHEIRILSGDDEANLIGRGLTCDPALRELRDFYVFDLGGGSLECLAFRARRAVQAASLPLGCVRLTEQFVADPNAPLPVESVERIAAHVRAQLAGGTFAFSLPAAAATVGTGGTLATARAILGARAGLAFEATPPILSVEQLRELLAWVGAMSLAQRRDVRRLPFARADVFPAALATFVALAAAGGFRELHHSLFNLRYGLAAEALAAG